MENVSKVQDSRLVVQDSRIEFSVSCGWCAGYGFEYDNGDAGICHECNGTGNKFHYVMEDKNGN